MRGSGIATEGIGRLHPAATNSSRRQTIRAWSSFAVRRSESRRPASGAGFRGSSQWRSDIGAIGRLLNPATSEALKKLRASLG